MSSLTGFVTSRVLTTKEIAEYREVAKRINPIFRALAMEEYGEIEMRRLHKEIMQKPGKLVKVIKLNKKQKEAVAELKTLTELLLESHIASAASLSRTFYLSRRGSSWEYDDYLQEACVALRDAVFCYDGSTIFTTYVYNVMQNRLIDVSKENRKDHEELQTDEFTPPQLSSWDKDPFETSELWNVYETTILTPIEKDAIEAYLHGQAVSDIGEKHIVTRQATAQALSRALTKVKTQYDMQFLETLERRAA